MSLCVYLTLWPGLQRPGTRVSAFFVRLCAKTFRRLLTLLQSCECPDLDSQKALAQLPEKLLNRPVDILDYKAYPW